MTLIAEFRLDIPYLKPSLSAHPDVRIELEHHAALDGDTAVLVFWAIGDDLEAFEESLREDATVGAVQALSEPIDGRQLLRVELLPRRVAYWTMAEVGAVLVDVVASHLGWEVAARFPSREALAKYRTFCREEGYSFDLEQLYQGVGSTEGGEYGVTEPQRELLEAAFEDGYFDVPRATTLSGLAEQFDISDQAASQRLRRGLSTLLERTLMRAPRSR